MAAMEAVAFSPSFSDHRSLLPSSRPFSISFSLRASPFLPPLLPSRRSLPLPLAPRRPSPRSALGENPSWNDDDYIVLGLAHCFRLDDAGKLQDAFLIEPISASSAECMENGGVTCYLHATATTLGVALQLDPSLLPPEFSSASFCDNFDFRAKCASRTWKREHAVENLMKLVPKGGVRSDFNFSVADKRVLNKQAVVTDADNIKQDMSIDVYGRNKEEKEGEEAQVASLYNA